MKKGTNECEYMGWVMDLTVNVLNTRLDGHP